MKPRSNALYLLTILTLLTIKLDASGAGAVPVTGDAEADGASYYCSAISEIRLVNLMFSFCSSSVFSYTTAFKLFVSSSTLIVSCDTAI